MKNNAKTTIFIVMKADSAMVGQIIIALGAIASMFLTAQKIIKNSKIEREQESLKLLEKASEELEKEKQLLEIKIQSCVDENERMKEMIEKDMELIKATYSAEIKNLGEKIESLKEEVRSQNTQILNLLSKLIS